MSCIRFTTKAQRRAMAEDAAALRAEDAAVLHLSPPVTETKLARLRLLAEHDRPGIRQSVASNRHAPAELLARLAADADPAVRGEAARNETVDAAVLSSLAADPDPRVRCWAILNPGLPEHLVAGLRSDPDEQVARLAGWRAGADQPAGQPA